MKNLLTLTRWVVGLLFIFSGLIKANDPMGLSYKMQEFFEVWNIHGFQDFTLSMAVLMIAFEIIAGVAVIVGWQFRLFSWLLLLLILFFTFLTAYALFSGKIKECGCFGDCIKLTAKDSFIKDIVLTILIVFLFSYRHRVRASLGNTLSFLIIVGTTIFSFAAQFYVLKHLPVLDCLPYRVGANIMELRQIPPDAIPDSVVITYVYKKNGKDIEFDADHFPADFNDSTYTFLNRYDKVVRKGNAEPKIKDFALKTLSDQDITDSILSLKGESIIIFSKSWNQEWTKPFDILKKQADAKGIPIFISTSAPDLVTKYVTVPVLKTDFVAIKTAARVDPTVYLLENGIIKNKSALADENELIKSLSN